MPPTRNTEDPLLLSLSKIGQTSYCVATNVVSWLNTESLPYALDAVVSTKCHLSLRWRMARPNCKLSRMSTGRKYFLQPYGI